MYTRFFRWASDRVDRNGIIAFVTNNSFVKKDNLDGFRKVVAQDFQRIYVIDLKGDSRNTGEDAKKEGGNVFNVRVGIAICLLIRVENESGCQIFYNSVDDYDDAKAKLDYLQNNHFRGLSFEHIVPDSKHTWINQGKNWDDLLPLSNKDTKFAESESEDNAIFSLSSPGVSTNRDEWVYDINPEMLGKKVTHLLNVFNRQVGSLTSSNRDAVEDKLDYSIKWSDGLRSQLSRGQKFAYDPDLIVEALYRPYSKQFYYASAGLSDRLTSNHFSIFGRELNEPNQIISVTFSSQVPFTVQASKYLHSLDYGSRGTQSLPLYRYDKAGNRLENITNWGLNQFRTHYADDSITKEDIFAYVYGVLHNPAYRKKYELNLRREFPRVPFYEDFTQWAAWGQKLLELHLNFETVEPYPLQRMDLQNVKNPKAKLKADKAAGDIILDSETILSGVPAAAWEYKLGNRSALEWVLERYKERTPKDKTVAEKFNTYRFADYKEDVIVLLGRVCAVSVQTSAVVAEMAGSE